jgi:hypothetical protein
MAAPAVRRAYGSTGLQKVADKGRVVTCVLVVSFRVWGFAYKQSIWESVDNPNLGGTGELFGCHRPDTKHQGGDSPKTGPFRAFWI